MPGRYRIIYSEYVRQELRKLGATAIERGLRQQFLDSLKQIESRLSIHPQFSKPGFVSDKAELRPSRLRGRPSPDGGA